MNVTNRIPNLELDWFVIDGDHPSSKLNTDSQIVHWLEPFIGELKKKA
jgi:hypothetical protein